MQHSLSMWQSAPEESRNEDEIFSVSARSPLAQSAPPVLQTPKNHIQKAEDLYKILTWLGSKILRYFEITPPQNSPKKQTPGARKARFEMSDLVARVTPSHETQHMQEQNQRLREIAIASNRNYADLMDVARLLMQKFNTLELEEYARHIRNWGIVIPEEAGYATLKQGSIVDLLILIYQKKRYPTHELSALVFFEQLRRADQPADYFVTFDEALAKQIRPLELFEMDIPVNTELKPTEEPRTRLTQGGSF